MTYSEAVKKSEEAVKEIYDPKLKLIAFETILKDVLSNKSPSNLNSKNSKIAEHETKKKSIKENQIMNKFVSFTGIQSKDLELVFQIYEDKKTFKIVSDFQYDLGKWSQITFVLLRLFGNYLINNDRKSLSLPVIREMKNYGYGKLPNINAFMRTISPSIVHVETKGKKSENTYQLTERGIGEVKKLIQEIVKNKGIVPLDKTHINFPSKVAKRSISPLKIQISDQITDGFFNSPRTIKELKQKLSEKGNFHERSIIDSKIRTGFLNKKLRRLKMDGKWHYVKK